MFGVTQHIGFMAAGGESDPYWSNTVLLLHFDGDGNDFIDSTGRHTMQIAGSASEVSTLPKFGKSGEFGPRTDYLYATDNINDFKFPVGTAFTIEFWLYRFAATDTARLFGIYASGYVAEEYMDLLLTSGGSFELSRFGGAYISTGNVFSLNTWTHLAVTRKTDGTVNVYVGGVSKATAVWNIAWQSPQTNLLFIGNNGISGRSDVRIDELRITKGVARYTANFIPPTAPFPNQ